MRPNEQADRRARRSSLNTLLGVSLGLVLGACAAGEEGTSTAGGGTGHLPLPNGRDDAETGGWPAGTNSMMGGSTPQDDGSGPRGPNTTTMQPGSSGGLPGLSGTGSPSGGGAPGTSVGPMNAGGGGNASGTTTTGTPSGAGGNAAGNTTPTTPTTPTTSTAGSCSAPSWSGVTPLVEQASDGLRSLRTAVQGSCLFVSVEFSSAGPNYALYLNTDGNQATGHVPGDWARAGADFLVQAGVLRSFTGAKATDWKWADPGKTVQVIPATRSLEFRIPLSAISVSSSSASRIWLGFSLLDSSFIPTNRIPNTGSFVSITGTGTSKTPEPSQPGQPSERANCPAPATTRAPRAASKGMIVPAYTTFAGVTEESWSRLQAAQFPEPVLNFGEWQIPTSAPPSWFLGQAELDWLRLVRGSADMKSAGLDLWIVVNGSNNGPLTSAADWSLAREIWGDIRANGGKIFGYIHTVKSPISDSKFVPITDVLAQIKTWVDNFPGLDGIMLDEFYPRFELFALNESGASTPAGCKSQLAPNYPNGVCASPVDRRFLDQNKCFDPGVQVDPVGGHYHTLIGRIRAAYPNLILIGNAGGYLYSNQLAYAQLVDALITYERSYAEVKSSGVTAQRPASMSEAALVHGAYLDDMYRAIDTARTGGFTHVYTTNEIYGGNVWGKLSDYFGPEVQYWTERR